LEVDSLAQNTPKPNPLVQVRWYAVKRREQLFFEVPQVLLILGVLAVAAWLAPGARLAGTHEQLGLPPCPSRLILGIPCPSCGLTTSFALMAEGRLGRAFMAHYFGPVLFAAMVGYGVLLGGFLVRRQRIRILWPDWMPITIIFTGIGLYILAWVVRVMQSV